MSPIYILRYIEVRKVLTNTYLRVNTDDYYCRKRNDFKRQAFLPDKSKKVGLPNTGSSRNVYNTFSKHDPIQYCHSQMSSWMLIHFKGHVIVSNPGESPVAVKPHMTPEFYIHAAIATHPILLKEIPTWKYRNLVRFRNYAVFNEDPPTDEQLRSFDEPLTDEDIDGFEATFRLCGH